MTVYTPDALAAAWQVTPATIRNLIRRGELRAVRIGRQYRILEEDAGEYLCSNLQLAASRGGSSSAGTDQTASAAATVYALRHAPKRSARQ